MKNFFAYLFLSLVYFSHLPIALADENGYVPEPLLLRSEALGQLFRSSPYAQRFQLKDAGDARVSLSRTYSNFWGHDVRYIVDAETRDDVLQFHYQPLANLEIYAALSERGFTKSGTDGLAVNFHKLFGLSQDGRLDAPKHNTRLSVPDFSLNYTNSQSKDVLSRQIELGGVFDINKTFNLGLPTTLSFFVSQESARDNPYFTGAVDGGFRLSSAYGWDNVSVFGSLSLGIFDHKKELQIATRERQAGGTLGAAYRFYENHEAVTQLFVYQPLFRNMGQLSRESYEIHAAYRYTYDQVQLEIGLVENVFYVYNSPDWGVSAGITYHFAK